jgi:hypothetical protein
MCLQKFKRCLRAALARSRILSMPANYPLLFTPGETKALAKSKAQNKAHYSVSKVHQISREWVTNSGWSSSLI